MALVAYRFDDIYVSSNISDDKSIASPFLFEICLEQCRSQQVAQDSILVQKKSGNIGS